MAQKINTAHYLISKFSFSPFFLQFNLCGNAQSLLRRLGDLMDANLKKSQQIENRKCKIKITEFCTWAGMTDKPATKYMKQLLQLRLIKLDKKLDKNMAQYVLGEIFSVWENLRYCEQISIGDLAISIGDLANSIGEIPILYIEYKTINKTINNGVEKSKAEKQKQKPSSILEDWCIKNNLPC